VFSSYKLTEMEKKIEELYKKKNILIPSDLNINNVADKFKIELDFSVPEGPQRAIWDDELTVIFLNPEQSEENQRKVFFHELGHPIMHCGNQNGQMKKTFREFQEAQANQFQLYAAIPFFMLNSLELPRYEYQIVELIKNVFIVPESLAKKRLEQIKRRILQSIIDKSSINQIVAEKKEMYESMISYPLLEDIFSPLEIKQYFTKPSKRKNKVYFDSRQDRVIPVWYCIEVQRGEVNWGKDFNLFPIDADFEFVPITEMNNQESDVLTLELFLHPSYPNDFAIDIKQLKKKLRFYDIDPYNIKRFIIPANILEEKLQLDLFTSKLNQRTELSFHNLT
jgi:Zn-dependent peptidase ImmA (M78 family)